MRNDDYQRYVGRDVPMENRIKCNNGREYCHGKMRRNRKYSTMTFVYFQSVGIAVEFCAHIARYFSVSDGEGRLERARISLAEMGSSVSY